MKHQKFVVAIFILSVVLLQGCKNGPQLTLPALEYLAWAEKNRELLTKVKEIGDLYYQAEYLPLDLKIAQRLKDVPSASLTPGTIDSVGNEYKGLAYFNIKIGLENGDPLRYKLASEAGYFERVRYYSFEVAQDIKLVYKGDTLACALHNFERTYGIASYISLVSGFAIGNLGLSVGDSDDLIIVIDDRVFKNGTVKLLFPKKELNKIPRLGGRYL